MADRRDRDRRRNKAETGSSRRPLKRESTKDSTRGASIVEEPADMRPQYASPSTFLRPKVGEAASYYTQSPLAEPTTAPPAMYNDNPPHRLSVSSSGSSSYIDISRSFPSKRPRGVGALQAFFTTPAEHKRRPRRRKSRRMLNLGGKNSSSSSINSDLAYGTGFIKRKKGERRRSLDGGRRSSKNGSRRDSRDENPDAKILAVGAGLAALAKKQNTMDMKEARRTGSFNVRRQDSGQRQGLESSRGIGSSKIHVADDDGWYSDDSDSGGSSVDSRLAYGGSTTNFFGFGGNKPQRPQPSRKSSVVDPKLFGPQNSLQDFVTRPIGFEEVDYGNLSDYRPPTVAEAVKLARHESRPTESVVSGTATLQHVYPVSTSDPTRFDVIGSSLASSQRNSRPEPVPLQHPQPYTPVSQSVYEPSISAPVISGQRKSQSVAGAALAGVAGAAIGAAVLSDHRDERKESRHRDDDRDRYENNRRREDRRERRPTQDYDSEKRSSRPRQYQDDPAVIEDRERRREKGGKSRDDFDEDGKRRQRRRTEERNDLRDDKRESSRYGDRFDEKESRRPANVTTSANPFQYEVAKDTFPTPLAAQGLESFTEINRAPSPAVITVERVPHFAKGQSNSIKDQGSPINDDDRRNYRESRDRKRTERDAKDIYEEIGHFTAPIEVGAIGAAVAAERKAEYRRDKKDDERRRRRDDDDDSDPRRKEPRRSKNDDSSKRDPVQEEADRIYREAILARKIASRKSDKDDVVRISTPPEMAHKPGPSPYEAPNADFHLDHVMDPTGFKEGITPIMEPKEFPLPKNYVHVQDEDVKANRRPLMTLIMPTPTPSPTPEKQKDRAAPEETAEPTQSNESAREVKETQTPSNGARSVTWGENQTKHYEPDSPQEHKDDFVESISKSSTSQNESKPKKPSRWGAVKGAFMGVGAAGGVAAANALVDAAEAKKEAKPEKESAKADSYEYRGGGVEPELSDDEKSEGPPAVGPKPPSPQSRSPVVATKVSTPHMPGSFADDLDFTATVAAGLQHSGFDPNIVIDDPKYRRRSSPPGTNDDSKGLYRQPYAETVSDLGHFPEKSEALQKSVVDGVENENDSRGVEVEFEDEFTTKLTKKEQRKREKAAKRQSTGDSRDMDFPEQTTVTDMLVEEPENYSEPSKSKKDKKSNKSKRSYDDDVDDEDIKRVSVPIDEYDDLLEKESKVETPVVEWDIPSKKSKKKSKRDSEIVDYPSRSMSTAETFEEVPSKKSKDKSKRKSEQYEPEIDPADDILLPSEFSNRSEESRKSQKSPKRDSSVTDDRSIRSESDERRKSKKNSKRDNSPTDDRSQVSSRYDDEGSSRSSKKKEKERENKNGGFFGLFGSSTSKSEPDPLQDDVEEPKRKKKSKRSSTADSNNVIDAQSHSNGNDKYHDDPLDSKKSINGDSFHVVEDEESYKKDENSFLGNAGTLGTGVGLAGAAVLAAQHMQSKAADADEEFDETNPFLYQVSDDAFSTPDASKDIDPFTDFVKAPDGSYKRVTKAETHESDLGTTISTTKDVIDPEISERQFRPSIDPQYGDLLPLPPSDPGSPDSKQASVIDLPELPESRPNSPPRFDQISSRDRPSALKKTDHQNPMKSPSASAVPLKFIMGNRSQPSSPRVAGPSPVTSPAVASPESMTLPTRPRPRPTSWDSTKEIQPLRLLDPSRKRDSVDLGRTQSVEADQTLDKVKSTPDELMEEESSKTKFVHGPDTPEYDSGPLVLSAIAGSALAFGTGALLTSLNNEGVKRNIQTIEHPEEFHEPSPVQPGTKERSSYLFHSTPPLKRFGDLEEASPELEPSSLGEYPSEVTQETPTKVMQRGLESSLIVDNEAHTELASPKMMAIVADKEVEKTEEFQPPEDESPSLSLPLACEMPTTEKRDPAEESSFIKPKEDGKQIFGDILAQEKAHLTASPPVEQIKETFPTDEFSIPKSSKKEKKGKKKQTFDEILVKEEAHPTALPPHEEVKDLDHIDELLLSKSKKDKKNGNKSAFEPFDEEFAATSMETTPLEDPAEEAKPEFEFSMSKSKKVKKKDKKKGANRDLEGSLSSSAVFLPGIDTTKRSDLTNEFRTPLEEPTIQPSTDFESSTPKSKRDKKKRKNGAKERSEESESLSSSAILPPIDIIAKEDDLPEELEIPLPEPAEPAEGDSEKDKKDKINRKSSSRADTEDDLAPSESILPVEELKDRESNPQENLFVAINRDPDLDHPADVEQDASVLKNIPALQDGLLVPDGLADELSMSKSKQDRKKGREWQPSAKAEEAPVQVKNDANVEKPPQIESVQNQSGQDAAETTELNALQPDLERISSRNEENRHGIDSAGLAGTVLTSAVLIDVMPKNELPQDNTHAISHSREEPTIEKAPDGFAAGYNAEQLEAARQMREDFGSGAMKTKKELIQDKKSARGKKSRSTSRTPQDFGSRSSNSQEPEIVEPEQIKEDFRGNDLEREGSPFQRASGGFAAGFTAEQLEDARQMREDFSSGSMKTKKELRQDKKKRQTLLRTVTGSNLEGSVDQVSEQASEVSSEVNSPTGTGASTPNIQEEFDEFSFAPKKSKKEKKRQSSLLRTSTLDIDPSTEILPTASTGLEGIQTEATDVVRGRELEKTPDSSVPAEEELSYSLKKSKKDKKAKKRQSSAFEDKKPVDTSLAESRELEVGMVDSKEAEVRLDSAEAVEEEIYSSKKSKKDKKGKKRQSSAFEDETPVKTRREVSREPESILIVAAAGSSDQEAGNRQLETNEQADEEFSLKRSKKDKKSKKRESPPFEHELPTDSPLEVSSRELESTSLEPIEPIASVQADPAQLSSTEPAEEEFYSLAKNEKDEKGKKLESTSVSPFQDELMTTEEKGSAIIAEAAYLSDKSVTGRSMADQIWDSVISPENEPTVAITETPAAESDDPLGFTAGTKKSKKDKKKNKGSATATPSEEDFPSEPVRALRDRGELEARDVPKTALPELINESTTGQRSDRNAREEGDDLTGFSTGKKSKGKKKKGSGAATPLEEDFRPGSIQSDEPSKIISTDPQALSTVVQPETEDRSGFNTGKKSKKDKTRKGSVSATPFEDEFEPGSIQSTDMLMASSRDLATEPGVNQADASVRSEEVEDLAGANIGKKSKKDKKKARKDSKTVELVELVAIDSQTRESPASNSVPDKSVPLSWADEVADAHNPSLKDTVIETHRHEDFGPISEQVFPESTADDTKAHDTVVSQNIPFESEPLADSTASAIIPEASQNKHGAVALAAAAEGARAGASLASDSSGKSLDDSKDKELISDLPLEPVSQETEAIPEISRSPSKKDEKGKRTARTADRTSSANDDILDDPSLWESADPRTLGDDKNEFAAEDGGDLGSVPVEVDPSIVEDNAAQVSTADRLDRQVTINMHKEDPQVRETPNQLSELGQEFEKEIPQDRESHREVPQNREERNTENPQLRESLRETRQPQEVSEFRELPQQREQPHNPQTSQSREISDEITDITEPGHKRAHEEVVDAALVAAGIHSVAGIDKALEQNAAKGKSYQSGGVVPDQQWNDLPNDFITKPSKKSKKGKNKSRLPAWDVPTRDGESAIVEAPMSTITQPETLATMSKSHERENSDYRLREVVDPQSSMDQKQEIITSIPKYDDPASETVDPHLTSFIKSTWSFPGHEQLQMERDQPSTPKTPENRYHNTVRNQDNHWSSPAPLPVVIEEDSPDQRRFAKTSPEPELRFRGHDPNDVNRDSGLVTGSPTPQHRAAYTDNHDHVRDSGVHLRDWPDSSPSKEKREISSTDDALARMSWPSVNEESETVDLDRSQRHQESSRPKDHSSTGSAVGAVAALAGAGMAIQGARSVSDTSQERGSDKTPHTERRASNYFAEQDSDRKVRPERRVSDKSAEKESKNGNRSKGHSSDKYGGLDSDKRIKTGHRPSDEFEEKGAEKNSRSERRSISPNLTRLQTPDHSKTRPASVNSNRSTASATPPLRRSDRRFSGDLRSLSQHSQVKLREAREAERSPATSIVNSGPIVANEGRVRSKDMADVYDGFGEGRIGSPMSPTRPHSMRRRQSMQVLDLEARLEQLSAENRALAEAKASAEQSLHTSRGATSDLAARETEVDSLKQMIDWLHKEVEKLKEVNDGLTSANIALGQQHNQRYDTLATQHEQATRELEDVRSAHGSLSAGMESIVRNEVEAATHEKDREIEQLKQELEVAKEQIREMQRQILASKAGDSEFLTLRDEDYFDTACQTLCQHVQQWVLRFSKFSDMRACRLTSEINNDKIIDRLDNAVLDGSDVDNYLSDRVKRRDIFMSMTMTMIWEFVFTRYLFGMDREQRQKLKALEKTLLEVGPASAVHQWRATTLTLLAKREAFRQQRELDTEAVVQLVFQTLSEILPPPTQLEDQIQDQLRRVMKAAVDLSIEMRTQRAEYMMLPPLQPVYDPNGDLAQQVHFNAALMNERSGDTSSNEDLEAQEAVVRVVLFPLVVKKGDDSGEGDEEIVVCPAQVLVAKSKKQVRVFSPDRMDMSQNHSRVSMQSGMPTEHVEDI